MTFCHSLQGEFRRGHSTIKTMGHLLNLSILIEIITNLWRLDSIDLKKAFNSVNHDILF